MAARARVRFGSRGSRGVINRFQAVGRAAAGTHRKTTRLNLGLGRAAHQAGRSAARFALFARGLRNLREAISGAERPWHRFGRGVEGILSALSLKFAQYRRNVWFYQRAVMFYGRQIKRIGGIFRRTGDDVAGGMDRMGRGGGGRRPPPRRPSAAVTPAGGPAALLLTAGAASKASSALSTLLRVFGAVGIAAGIVTAGIAAVGTALGVLYSIAGYFTAKFAAKIIKGFYDIRETFRMYEISLGGIIRSTKATAKVMAFAMKYAAEYPAMFEDVIDAFRGLASMPTLKPMFRKANYDDLKGIMDVVQGLATLKPQQGVSGAMMALREALSGQMRSLRMRFEVNVREMAEAAGYSFTEITHDANKALIAIRKFVELNVPVAAMGSMAMTVSVQYGNLFDKYRTFVNAMMKSTGAYWAVVAALKHLNEWLEKVFKAPGVIAFAQKVGSAMREVVKAFEGAVGLIDWDKYLAKGDVVGALKKLGTIVRMFFSALWSQVGDDTKNTLRSIVRLMASLLWASFKVMFSAIWEMIKMGFVDAAKASAKAFVDAFKAQLGVGRAYGSSWLYMMSQGLLGVPAKWGEDIRKRKPSKPSTPEEQRFRLRQKPVGVEVRVKFVEPEVEMRALKAAMEEKIKKLFQEIGVLKPEPVEVGEDIVVIENKRLKVVKMALRMFKEWTDEYKWQKKDAEGLLAVTKKLAAIIALPALIGEKRAAAAEIDRIGAVLKRLRGWERRGGRLPEAERLELLEREEKLTQRVASLTDRIAVAKTTKAEDLNKLLQAGIKARDAILKKEEKITEQVSKTRKEIAKIVLASRVGLVGAVTSFYEKWKDALRFMRRSAAAMGAMIPGGIFGQGKPEVSWAQGLQKGKGVWRGVPDFFRVLEDRLEGMYGAAPGAAGKRTVAQQLMSLYEGMFATARGRTPKRAIAAKAMELFPRLLQLQAAEASEAAADRQKQIAVQTALLLEGKLHTGLLNQQLAELQRIVAVGGRTGRTEPTPPAGPSASASMIGHHMSQLNRVVWNPA